MGSGWAHRSAGHGLARVDLTRALNLVLDRTHIPFIVPTGSTVPNALERKEMNTATAPPTDNLTHSPGGREIDHEMERAAAARLKLGWGQRAVVVLLLTV